MNDPAPRSSSRRPPKQGTGLVHAIRSLSAAQQRTAAAAIVVLVSLGTPWYSTQIAFKGGGDKLTDGTMSGISAFSFVEAAVLLVGVAVLALVWARATDRRFSLPLADGTVITAAAAWIGVLIVYRLFDKPEGKAENGSASLIGLSWGIFASLFAVGLLLATGLDQRRRDAELRAETAAPPERPVVDPDDLVEPETTVVPAAPATPAERSRRGAGAPEPAEPEPERRPASRSWAFDDPELPPPPPAAEPSRRRPTPPEDPTRVSRSSDDAPPAPEPGTSVGRLRRRRDD